MPSPAVVQVGRGVFTMSRLDCVGVGRGLREEPAMLPGCRWYFGWGAFVPVLEFAALGGFAAKFVQGWYPVRGPRVVY